MVLYFQAGQAFGQDSVGTSLGIDFTRSVSFEGPTDPLADFTNFRLSLDGKRNRIELEGVYYFRTQDREAGSGTNSEKQETRHDYFRSGLGIFFRSGGEAFLYGGPKFIYQKIASKSRQGNSNSSQDLDLLGGGLVLGLERKLVERLSLAGEFQALYAYGSLDESGLGNCN